MKNLEVDSDSEFAQNAEDQAPFRGRFPFFELNDPLPSYANFGGKLGLGPPEGRAAVASDKGDIADGNGFHERHPSMSAFAYK